MMRLAGWSQILFAAALNLDTESVHGQMAYHSIAFLLVAQPSFEKFQCPKAPDAVWMAICAAVGYKTLDGSLNKWVATAIWLANGAQFWLAPQSAIDLYEMKGDEHDGRTDAVRRRLPRVAYHGEEPVGGVRLRHGHERPGRCQVHFHGRGRPQDPEDRPACVGRPVGGPRLQVAQLGELVKSSY